MMSTLLLDSNSYRLGKFRFQISEKPAFFKHVTPFTPTAARRHAEGITAQPQPIWLDIVAKPF